ncbi:hypothetical protein GGS23DRAFT_376248 [Durotheca rogersii]|uniref:uncharacterized protein n=1 Tax=Durotheca rogersii TaxID=419775 RepID=UPI00221E39EE|nr:uncharacterized protein GGS23DRAFT_376248 [Durotheca rogersii]KAI5866231.1 hypothetical protein GGS23DRAFT_376248 [Durotheca rogersii]
MGRLDDKPSELDQVSSLEASTRASHAWDNDDDDYDLQAMGLADGFFPTQNTHIGADRLSTTPGDPPSARVPPPRPSSITKPHRREDSLTLGHDGSSSDASSEISRVSTVSITSPFADPEEPYNGPSGPSHPYQMYPQNVRMARTASLATTSTAPVSERSYTGPRGPTHPYGMYPQGTVPGAQGALNLGEQESINVGFVGATDNYRRRIGPDGEDAADLIGPDGHTEQLPPYTRYPEEAYHRKALGIEDPRPAVTAQPMLAIPGAGGIGLAARNPEFASTEDLAATRPPQSRQSVQSFLSDSSRQEMNAVARSDSAQPGPVAGNEKAPLKDWQVTAKRRVWGIVPCWAIVLAAIVLVLMGIILGAVIGTLVNPRFKKGPPPNKPPSPETTLSPWDTQPISALPSDLPPLFEGKYAMPLLMNRMSTTCFGDSTMSQAWNCNIVFSQLAMTVRKRGGEPDVSNYVFDFSYNNTQSLKNYVYSYGTQPPDLSNLKMVLVDDVYELSRGPAWSFIARYDKVVIVPEYLLAPSSAPPLPQARRRMSFGGDFKRKSVAQVGDRPWVCRWDNTILEGFIYANQSNSFSRSVDPRPVSSTLPAALSGNAGSAPAATPTGDTGALSPQTNGGFVASNKARGDPSDQRGSPSTVDSTPATTTSSPASSSSSGLFNDDAPSSGNTIPVYPQVIKIAERRDAASAMAKPRCRQYQIVGEYQEAIPMLDTNGNFIEIDIDEHERSFENPAESRRSTNGHHLWPRGDGKIGSDMTDCSCMWWLT